MSCFGCCGLKKPGSWVMIGPGNTHLYQQVESLYWTGVEQELENIIRTLRCWQTSENSDVHIDDESDDYIHGYDTFLGQVSSEQRAFAKRYGDQKEQEAARDSQNQTSPSPESEFTEALQMANRDQRTLNHENTIKDEVKDNIASMPRLSGIENRACMLLQAAGFLDIDKLIEHRPPLDDLGFWSRPSIPQLKMTSIEDFTPQFGPLRCQKEECHRIIRGSMFVKEGETPELICETCYRAAHYGESSFKKVYKHCVLPEVITTEISSDMCGCESVPHLDQHQQKRELFPVEIDEKHLDGEEERCKILNLGRDIALAKYHGIQDVAEENTTEGEQKDTLKKKPSKFDSFMQRLLPGKYEEEKRPNSRERTTTTTEAEANGDIPFFFRQYTQQYPFGNVHMALRVGPLIIENGVPNTKGGALVSLREYPVFQDRLVIGGTQRRLAIVEDEERNVWEQNQRHSAEKPKRYKAVMKQVVGVPFTGVLSNSKQAEHQKEIITLMIEGSRQQFDDNGLLRKERSSILRNALNPVMAKIKALIGSRVKIYLASIVDRLLQPETPLRWSRTSNNCQTFCDNLINDSIFGSLVTRGGIEGGMPSSLLYLMSFVCPQESYLRNRVRTKYDVPCGLTEEYLLKFHFGRHDEADIIDDLHEYWYDWGAFGAPLYKNQDLFPWDCTEAYDKYPTKCNDCNLAKHILAFPFDSWSIIELHLHRDRHMYPSSDGKWMQNRLKVLAAVSLLARAAAGMVKSMSFRTATEWLNPKSNTPLSEEPGLARVKLGGIHRAQPFSHYFEAGKYHLFFQAEWAIRKRPQQIKEYEALRDKRWKKRELEGGAGGGGGRFTSNDIDVHDIVMFDQMFQGFYGFVPADDGLLTDSQSHPHDHDHGEITHDEIVHESEVDDGSHKSSTAYNTNPHHDSDADTHTFSPEDTTEGDNSGVSQTAGDHTTASTPHGPYHTVGSSGQKPSKGHSGRDDSSDVGTMHGSLTHLYSSYHQSKPPASTSEHLSFSNEHAFSLRDYFYSATSSSTPPSSTPTHSAPTHSTPAHSAPTHSTPAHSTPTHSAPTHSTPAHSTPAHSAPTHSTPPSSTPTHSAPTHSTPTHSAPTHSTPTYSTPAHSAPTHRGTSSSTQSYSTPTYSTPTHRGTSSSYNDSSTSHGGNSSSYNYSSTPYGGSSSGGGGSSSNNYSYD